MIQRVIEVIKAMIMEYKSVPRKLNANGINAANVPNIHTIQITVNSVNNNQSSRNGDVVNDFLDESSSLLQQQQSKELVRFREQQHLHIFRRKNVKIKRIR